MVELSSWKRFRASLGVEGSNQYSKHIVFHQIYLFNLRVCYERGLCVCIDKTPWFVAL